MFILALFAKDSEVQDDELNEMLKDENIYEMFLAFCKKEYSVENLYCWMDIQKFKALEVDDPIMKSLNSEKKKNGMYVIHAKRICDKYFHGDKSVMEVNIQKKEYEEIWRKLLKKQADRAFFDVILVSIKVNMMDTLTRFKLSSAEYRKYLMEVKIAKSLMEQDDGGKKQTTIFERIGKNFRKKTGIFDQPAKASRNASVALPLGTVIKVDDSVTQPIKTKDMELKEVVVNSSQSSNQIGITTGDKVVEVEIDGATSKKKLCDVCDEKEAVSYCPLCNQSCCDGCLQFNHRTEAKKGHCNSFIQL